MRVDLLDLYDRASAWTGEKVPEVPVADDAPMQDRLLGYTGRDPR